MTLHKTNEATLVNRLTRPADTPKMAALIQGIHRGQFNSDQQAATALYGPSRSMDAFRHLKARLRRRLVNQAMQSDRISHAFSPFEKTMHQVRKTLIVAHTLYYFDHRQTAVSLLKEALKTSVYYERPEFALQACSMLCRYTAFTGSRKFSHYHKQYRRLKEQSDALSRSEELEYLSTSLIFNVAGYTARIRRKVGAYFREMRALRRRYPINMITIRYFRLAVRYHHSRWEYDHIIRESRAALRYLRSDKRHQLPGLESEFSLLEMEACMQSGKVKTAMELIRATRPRTVKGTSTWYVINEYYFLLAMRTGRYEKALSIYREVFPKTGWRKRAPLHNERWLILEAYLQFAMTGTDEKARFNLYRFLNEVPVAGRDKAGYNFSVHVARLILLIKAGRYDRLVGLEEPFKQYLHRHISHYRHPRHYAFGHMLRKLLAGKVRPGAPNKVIERFHKRLATHRGAFKRFEETEIIPYEELWSLIISRWTANAPGRQS